MPTIWSYVCNRCRHVWQVATGGNSPPPNGAPPGKGPKCPECGFAANSPNK
jgi:hypothetical protein